MDAYKSWDLFLIFLSIVVLIGGVVLLTNKKPEKLEQAQSTQLSNLSQRSRSSTKKLGSDEDEDGEEAGLRRAEPGEEEVMWQLGEDSDDENGIHATPDEGKPPQPRRRESHKYVPSTTSLPAEHTGLIQEEEEEEDGDRGGEETLGSRGSGLTHADETFGNWHAASSSVQTR